jgi:hypothetical protein
MCFEERDQAPSSEHQGCGFVRPCGSVPGLSKTRGDTGHTVEDVVQSAPVGNQLEAVRSNLSTLEYSIYLRRIAYYKVIKSSKEIIRNWSR